MKYTYFLLISLIVFMNNQISAQDLKTDNDSLSYAYGIFIASQLQGQNIKNIDSKLFTGAISAQLDGAETLMNMEEAKAIIGQMQQKQQASVGSENKIAGEAFLAENGKRAGVVTTASGLQYEIITEGTGAIPTETSTVNTHYHGTLITGEVFDSSVERGEPISFPVNGVIKGWTEALQLMKVGSKYKLFIPSDLAYGPRGAGASIGPNAALVFEVELLGIDK